MDWRNLIHTKLKIIIVSVVGITFFSNFILGVRNSRRNVAEFNAREEEIYDVLECGGTEIEVPAIEFDTKFDPIIGDDLSWNVDDSANSGMARYYGLEKVYRKIPEGGESNE